MVIENTDGLEENIPFDIKISNIVTDFDVPNFLKFIGKFLSRQTKWLSWGKVQFNGDTNLTNTIGLCGSGNCHEQLSQNI